MSIMEDFSLYLNKQKSILDQTFLDDSAGYLGIVEVPHNYIFATITSSISLEHFKEEIASFPYHYVWEVSELKKVTSFVDTILAYIDEMKVNDFDLEDKLFNLMIFEIKPYLIQEIDPYQ